MRRLFFVLLLLFTADASAQTYFNYNQPPFTVSPSLGDFGLGSTLGEREAAIHAALQIWRSINGPSSPPSGSLVQIVYKDGSREKCVIKSTAPGITACLLQEGSYEPPPGKSTGFGAAGPGWYAWTGTVWTFGGQADMVVRYGEVGEVTPAPPDDTDEP